MRTVKKADVRKNEILDAAAVLFAEKGFDNTSITDILSAVDIAKGTLYHHFKSKEDIMDALVERQTARILSAAETEAGDRSKPLEERMLRTIRALHVESREQEMIEHLHKAQNALMHQKTKRIILKRVPPMMAGILQDGIAQGIFETPFPLECMEMAVCYLDCMLDDDVFELTEEQQLTRIQAFIFHMERILGVKRGELEVFGKAFQNGTGEA